MIRFSETMLYVSFSTFHAIFTFNFLWMLLSALWVEHITRLLRAAQHHLCAASSFVHC